MVPSLPWINHWDCAQSSGGPMSLDFKIESLIGTVKKRWSFEMAQV